MRYGLSRYDASVYNAQIFAVSGVVEVRAAVGGVNRLCNVKVTRVVVCSATVSIRAECFMSSFGSVETVAQAVPCRVRNVCTNGVVEFNGLAAITAMCTVATNATVVVVGQVHATCAWQAETSVLIQVAVFVVTRVDCFVQASANAFVLSSISRTRVKYTSFDHALVIRAANKEGIQIPSAGVLYTQQGALEFLVQPFTTTASALRYLFDGGGVTGKDLEVTINTDGSVKVLYGTGSGTETIASTVKLPTDGGTWIGVGWDSTGVALYINGQLTGYGSKAPNLEFGADFYVGCSATQGNSLDGLLEEFRVSSRKRTAVEFYAAFEAGILGVPLEWDIDTTYLLHFDNNLNAPSVRQGIWQSPTLVVPDDTDCNSLVIYWEDEVPSHTAVVCQVRTSPDGQEWSYWYDVVSGDFSSAPANPYIQIRFILQTLDNSATPTMKHLVASFEGTASTKLLYSGLSPSDCYTFAQLQDTLVVCNGVDQPKKFDGETVSDITAAPRAALVAVWRNRIFMAKAPMQLSHLYFSDLLSIDSWPAENFIAVNPSDGDEIMALLPTASTLLIVKQHRIYQLQGYSPDTFQVSLVGEGGTISPWGIVDTPYGLFRLDREGVWSTDLRRNVLITQDIDNLWKQLNQRELKKAALFYYDQKLLVAVPKAGSNYNNLLLVYDLRHESWTVWEGWYPSCFQIYWERGKWTNLFGDSRKGNVYAIGERTDDSGVPFEMVIETANLPLISDEIAKRLKWIDVALGSAMIPTKVQVGAVVDGTLLTPHEFTVDAGQVNQAFRIYVPSQANTAGIRVAVPQATAEGPVLLGTVLTYFQQAIRPKVVQ